MKTSRLILSMILVAGLATGSAPAQQKVKLGENAALRYWSAFAQMQDSAITDQQVKELSAILDGTTPYDDPKYKDLIEKNKHASKPWPVVPPSPTATGAWTTNWGQICQLITLPRRRPWLASTFFMPFTCRSLVTRREVCARSWPDCDSRAM